MKKTKKQSSSHKTTKDGFWFDRRAADRACRFFELMLHHVKGEWAGQPFTLQRWQKDQIIRPLFGWKRPDGTRKYRKAYVEIPRKNGKSSLGAGIALYLLFADDEPGGEVYSAAADREQAAVIFDIARQMVELEPELLKRAELYRRSIFVPKTGSAYQVLSADAPTKHGKNSHAVIFDELHAQPDRELFDVLKTSTGARRQPLMLMFTTAGYDRHSVCWEEHEYALKVRDQIIHDDTYLPVIYSADQQDDWSDLKVWSIANPGLNVSIKQRYLEDECNRAKESPAYQNTFRRLHLNQWTEQHSRWIDVGTWDECATPVVIEDLRGRECLGGLDLSSTTDLSAFVLLFPPDQGNELWQVHCRFWMPNDHVVRRVARDRVPYDRWIREGWIEATEGNVIDYEVLRKRIHEDAERFRIREIAFDRWNATQLCTQLQSDGLEMIPFGQGFASMSAPTKELEKMILGRQLAHGGHPVLRWMVSNVAVKQDPAGNLKPDKSKSSDRIDGIVALVMALGRATVASEGPKYQFFVL